MLLFKNRFTGGEKNPPVKEVNPIATALSASELMRFDDPRIERVAALLETLIPQEEAQYREDLRSMARFKPIIDDLTKTQTLILSELSDLDTEAESIQLEITKLNEAVELIKFDISDSVRDKIMNHDMGDLDEKAKSIQMKIGDVNNRLIENASELDNLYKESRALSERALKHRLCAKEREEETKATVNGFKALSRLAPRPNLPPVSPVSSPQRRR